MNERTIYFEDADNENVIVRKNPNKFALEYISKSRPVWEETVPNSSYEREFYLGEGNCCLFSIPYEDAKQRLAEWGVTI